MHGKPALRRVLAAGIVAVAALSRMPAAMALPAPTTVLTDPVGDTTYSSYAASPVPANAPNVDIVSASLASTGDAVTVSFHVTDIDGRPALGGGGFGIFDLATQIGNEGVRFTLAYTDGFAGHSQGVVFDPGAETGCSLSGTPAVVDTTADTVSATFSIQDMNQCPQLQSAPIRPGTVANGFSADSSTADTAFFISDFATSSSSYTF